MDIKKISLYALLTGTYALAGDNHTSNQETSQLAQKRAAQAKEQRKKEAEYNRKKIEILLRNTSQKYK